MRIGVCVPIGERGPERRPVRFSEMRNIAVATEHGGLDSIWVADHLFIAAPDSPVRGVWESMAVLGALADATTRVELGPLVLCTPFRNPGMIAWAANTLDEISGGRFVLGLGSGWHQPEFDGFGFEFRRRVSVFEDSLEVIVPLLRHGGVDYEGNFAAGHAELRPPGPRPKGPPILIAGTRPRMMSLIAKWADRWNSVWYGLPTDEFRDERADLEATCAKAGRDPATIEISVGIAVQDPRTLDRNGPEAVVGAVEPLAEGFEVWRNEGVDEVMCRLEPPSTGVVETIAEAAARSRSSGIRAALTPQ
jgi:alkanesulfonate monooxygenase SsuD/methylene tetrahydromethanopterin reductase-like flavin-dependent oxidoreductase (luciferase family)